MGAHTMTGMISTSATEGFIKFFSRIMVGHTSWQSNVMEYQDQVIKTLLESLYPEQGVIGRVARIVCTGGAGTMKFNMVGTGYWRAYMDGKLGVWSNVDPGWVDVPYVEGVNQYIGVNVDAYPEAVDVGTDTTLEFKTWKVDVGITATPTGITDNGDGTMRVTVGTTNVDWTDTTATRPCVVYKVNPATGSSEAVYAGVIEKIGGQTVVDVPHGFGQTVISTTVGDYRVFIKGPIVAGTAIPTLYYTRVGRIDNVNVFHYTSGGDEQNRLGDLGTGADTSESLGVLFGDVVLEGGGVAAGVGLTVDIDAGRFLCDGWVHEADADTGVVVPGASERYVYFDPLTDEYGITDTLPLDDGRVLLYWVETDGAGVIDTVDMRKWPVHVVDKVDLLVGSTPECHFTTLLDAIRFLYELHNPVAGTALDRTYKIVVVGDVDAGGDEIEIPSNCIIEGMPGAKIQWGTANALFLLDNVDDVVIRDLVLEVTGAVAAPAAPQDRVAFKFDGASSCNRIRIENVKLTDAGGGAYPNGFLWVTNTGVSLVDCSIRDCYLEEGADFLFYVNGTTQDVIIDTFSGLCGSNPSGGAQTDAVRFTGTNGFTLRNVTVRDNANGKGIVISGGTNTSGSCQLDNCMVWTSDDTALEIGDLCPNIQVKGGTYRGGAGVDPCRAVDILGDYNLITSVDVLAQNAAALVQVGVHVRTPGTTATYNRITDSNVDITAGGGGTSRDGILIDAGSNYTIVTGCQTNNEGLTNNNGVSSTVSYNRDD